MLVKRYRILNASASRLLELAVNEAMDNRNAVPLGSPFGNMAVGFSQAIVQDEEVEDAPEQTSGNE